MGNGIDYSIASDRLTDNLMVYLHSYIFIYHPPSLPSAQAHGYPMCNVCGGAPGGPVHAYVLFRLFTQGSDIHQSISHTIHSPFRWIVSGRSSKAH